MQEKFLTLNERDLKEQDISRKQRNKIRTEGLKAEEEATSCALRKTEEHQGCKVTKDADGQSGSR